MNDMNIIEIWTDGSYRAKKGGYSFYINAPCILEKPVLVYSFVKAKKSIRVELLSIINALKYLYYTKIDLTNNIIRVMCDEASIVDAFNNKKYMIWKEKCWRKGNGKAVKSCVNEWFQLTCLVEAMPENNIEFIKVQSKKDCGNRLVDRYSNYARNMDSKIEGRFFLMEYLDDKKEFIEKEILDSIDSDLSRQILNGENPWDKPYKTKRVKWKYNEEDVIFINPASIDLSEDVHLNCSEMTLGRLLKKTLKTGQLKIPVVVRPMGERYSLVAGITRLAAAKLLNLSQIPCVVLNLNHDEFIKEHTVIIERL